MLHTLAHINIYITVIIITPYCGKWLYVLVYPAVCLQNTPNTDSLGKCNFALNTVNNFYTIFLLILFQK